MRNRTEKSNVLLCLAGVMERVFSGRREGENRCEKGCEKTAVWGDGESEEWITIVKVSEAPGWNGKVTVGRIISELAKYGYDSEIQMKRVPKGCKIEVNCYTGCDRKT